MTTTLTRPAYRRGNLAALQRANRVRLSRSTIRYHLAAGVLDLEEAVAHPDMATAFIYDVVTALPGVGRHYALKALNRTGISETRECRMVTPRQARQLAEALAR